MEDVETQTPGEISAAPPSAPSEMKLTADGVSRYFADAESEPEEASQAAAGSETPGETPEETPDAEATEETGATPEPETEQPLVPSFRLREETEKRREAEAQMQALQQQIEALKAQPAPEAPPATPETPADPLEAFHQDLVNRGKDPYDLAANNAEAYEAQYAAFEARQLAQSVQQMVQAQQAEAQAVQAQQAQQMKLQQWESDVQALQGKYPNLPILHDEEGVVDLVAGYIARHQNDTPNRAQFEAHVARYAQSADALVKATEQRFAAAKAGDAVVPVASGGSSPAPVTLPDFHSMKPAERERAMTAHAQALTRTP